MTLREFISKLDETPESQKDKILKYCGEWEAEFDSFELMEHDGVLLLMFMQ